MTPQADHLLAEALRLPEAERADLAARLIESLDPAAEDDVGSAWKAEIQDRLEDLDQGRAQAIAWSEARRLIQQPEGTDEA